MALKGLNEQILVQLGFFYHSLFFASDLLLNDYGCSWFDLFYIVLILSFHPFLQKVTDSPISRIAFSHNDSHIAAASKGNIYLLSTMNNSIGGPYKIFDKVLLSLLALLY